MISRKLARLFVFAAMAMITASLDAAVIWSGQAVSFTKENNADPTDPANQDAITANVALTRGFTAGLFNAVVEDFYSSTSPADTQWAFVHNNPGQDIAASNYQELVFDNWVVAFGGPGAGGPQSTVGQPAVVHLVTDDIYIDITFTSWQAGGAPPFANGFSYVRAPEPGMITIVAGGLALCAGFRRRRQLES